MTEPDDRLAGDEVWEIYPAPGGGARSRFRRAVGWMPVVGLGLIVWPPLAIVAICLAVGWGDFARGCQATRWVSDPMAVAVTRRFNLAWGFWKAGATGFGLMFATLYLGLLPNARDQPGPPAEFAAAGLIFFIAFLLSAMFTAAGLRAALKGGLRVWIGEGINQARTLLLGMLVVGFTGGFLIPASLLLIPAGKPGDQNAWPFLVLFVGGLIVGPITLLLLLDWLAARVLSNTPAKFGPKTAAVGKWAVGSPTVAGPGDPARGNRA